MDCRLADVGPAYSRVQSPAPQRPPRVRQTLAMVVKRRSDPDSVESHVDAYMDQCRTPLGP